MGGAASKAARRYPSAKKAVADSPGPVPERVYPPAPVGAAEMEVPIFETAGNSSHRDRRSVISPLSRHRPLSYSHFMQLVILPYPILWRLLRLMLNPVLRRGSTAADTIAAGRWRARS